MSLGRWILLCAGAISVLCLLAARGTDDEVVVRNYSGERIAGEGLPESGRFSLTYRHSYYEAPATEHFVAGASGFRLVGITSTSGGVLDYYELEGEREQRGEWIHLDPQSERFYESLPLIATQKGRRTLVVSENEMPLYNEDGSQHLTIRVEKDPFDGLLSSLNYPR